MSQRACNVLHMVDEGDTAQEEDPPSLDAQNRVHVTAPAADIASAGAYPQILTTAMAADMLHVHVEYLRKMVREHRIPAHRFPGGREIRFLRDELIAWVRDQPGDDRSPSASGRARR